MKNFNILKFTLIFGVLFALTVAFYYIFAQNIYSSFDNTTDITNYLKENYKTILYLEPYIKQTLLTILICFFSLGVLQNILKLSNVNKLFIKIYFYTVLAIVVLLTLLLTITIFYGNLFIYQTTTILMFLLTLIWISTIMIDFIKTKNNYQSIFIRVGLAVLGLMLIISVGYKVTNDYKVNVSINNSYEYKIVQLENALEYLDEESKVLVLKQIDYYQMMQIPMYSNGLYSGKSAFSMYNILDTNLFSENRLTQIQDAIEQINNLVFNYDDSDVTFEKYDINSGLYVVGDFSKILMVLILICGGICSFKYPLLREELEDTDSEVEEILTVKLIKNLITKEEFKKLMKEVE